MSPDGLIFILDSEGSAWLENAVEDVMICFVAVLTAMLKKRMTRIVITEMEIRPPMVVL